MNTTFNPESEFPIEPEPALAAMLNVLRDVPERNLVNASRGRAAFLAQVAAVQPKPKTHGNTNLVSWVTQVFAVRSQRAMRPIMAMLIVASAAVLGGATTVVTAQGSLPNDALYPVKTWSEDVRLSLTRDGRERLNLLVEYSHRRDAELTALNAQHTPVSDAFLTRFGEQVDEALQLAAGSTDASTATTRDALEQARKKIKAQKSRTVAPQSQPTGEPTDAPPTATSTATRAPRPTPRPTQTPPPTNTPTTIPTTALATDVPMFASPVVVVPIVSPVSLPTRVPTRDGVRATAIVLQPRPTRTPRPSIPPINSPLPVPPSVPPIPDVRATRRAVETALPDVRATIRALPTPDIPATRTAIETAQPRPTLPPPPNFQATRAAIETVQALPTPEHLETPDVPEATESPEAPEAPEAPETPKPPEQPEQPERPEPRPTRRPRP